MRHWALAMAVLMLVSAGALWAADQARTTPEELVGLFSDALAKVYLTGETADVEPLVTKVSAQALELQGSALLDALQTYLLYPAMQPGKPAEQGEAATVTVTLAPRTLSLKLAREAGDWKVDLLATAAGLPMPFRPEVPTAQEIGCQIHLKHLADALLAYADEHEGKLPKAENWMDAIKPYLEDAEAYRCPGAPDMEYAHAFNARLSGKKLEDVVDQWATVLVFDCKTSKRNVSGGTALVADPPRHGEAGNAYATCDGGVALYPEVPNFDPTVSPAEDEGDAVG